MNASELNKSISLSCFPCVSLSEKVKGTESNKVLFQENIVQEIFAFLSVQDAGRSRRVCRKWDKILSPLFSRFVPFARELISVKTQIRVSPNEGRTTVFTQLSDPSAYIWGIQSRSNHKKIFIMAENAFIIKNLQSKHTLKCGMIDLMPKWRDWQKQPNFFVKADTNAIFWIQDNMLRRFDVTSLQTTLVDHEKGCDFG